jgi:hypothetical protein
MYDNKEVRMDTLSISGSLLLMRAAQTQQSLSMTMMKQAAIQQNQMAHLLAQNAAQTSQPAADISTGFNFSTYA